MIAIEYRFVLPTFHSRHAGSAILLAGYNIACNNVSYNVGYNIGYNVGYKIGYGHGQEYLPGMLGGNILLLPFIFKVIMF